MKRAANPPTPVPSVHHDRHSPIVMPVLPSVTKEPRVVPATKHIHKTVLQKHVTAEPRVKHKTTRHYNIPLRHRHPVVQNKTRLLGRLRPTKSRLTILVKTSINNSHFQAQSVQNVEDYQGRWACPVYHPETEYKQSLYALFRVQQSITWNTSLTNEIGRLTQGIGKNRPAHKKIEGTNTPKSIKRRQVPWNAKVTYANFVCDIKTQKAEFHRTRLTVGYDKLDYPAYPSASAVVLLDKKIHLNSVISDSKKGYRYFVGDIKNYCLNNLLTHLKYMRIHAKYFTEEFRK